MGLLELFTFKQLKSHLNGRYAWYVSLHSRCLSTSRNASMAVATLLWRSSRLISCSCELLMQTTLTTTTHPHPPPPGSSLEDRSPCGVASLQAWSRICTCRQSKQSHCRTPGIKGLSNIYGGWRRSTAHSFPLFTRGGTHWVCFDWTQSHFDSAAMGHSLGPLFMDASSKQVACRRGSEPGFEKVLRRGIEKAIINSDWVRRGGAGEWISHQTSGSDIMLLFRKTIRLFWQ